MADEPDNTGEAHGRDDKGRWRRGVSGNPAGMPKGTRHKAILAAEALIDGESETLTRKAIEMAKGGDTTALKLVMDRLLPPRRERPISTDLPTFTDTAELPAWTMGLLERVAAGEITPGEAVEMAKVAEGARRATELVEFDQRLAALERQLGSKTK
jgi:hypothetical protein